MSSGQREHQAQACESTLRTGSAITDNPGTREVIPTTSVGWAFVKKESPLALSSDGCSGLIDRLFRATTLGSRLWVRRPRLIGQNIPIFESFFSFFANVQYAVKGSPATFATLVFFAWISFLWRAFAAGGERWGIPCILGGEGVDLCR